MPSAGPIGLSVAGCKTLDAGMHEKKYTCKGLIPILINDSSGPVIRPLLSLCCRVISHDLVQPFSTLEI